MADPLVTAVLALALALATVGAVTALLGRAPGYLHLGGLAAVEGVLVVQAVTAIAQMFGGDRPEQLATFTGYLLTVVLVPPLAALLSSAERSRWGSVIVTVAALVVAVLVFRLQQVWAGG